MPIKNKNDLLTWILFIACVLIVIDAVFNGDGIVFSLIVCAALIYFGRKKMPSRSGKLMFWGGILVLVISVLDLFVFKFLIVVGIIYLISQFYQSKKTPNIFSPIIQHQADEHDEDLLKREPIIKTVAFGRQHTPESVYEWSDINIQCGMGDTVIDLSETILPKGESVIFVRGFIGNLTIHIPYEIEVTVRHSAFAGNTTIFEHEDPVMLNQTVFYRTKGYKEAEKKVKIMTSLIAGSMEVKRV